jgi:soluble lytic murein transglycosylase-like protein
MKLSITSLVRMLVVALPLPLLATQSQAGQNPIDFFLTQQKAAAAPLAGPDSAKTIAATSEFPLFAALDQIAENVGVPTPVARAVMTVESHGKCALRSPTGAMGAMQVLPGTAHSVGVYGSLYDCNNSMQAGVRVLRRIIANHGLTCASMGLYNRGENARPVCTAYGLKIMHLAQL